MIAFPVFTTNIISADTSTVSGPPTLAKTSEITLGFYGLPEFFESPN